MEFIKFMIENYHDVLHSYLNIKPETLGDVLANKKALDKFCYEFLIWLAHYHGAIFNHWNTGKVPA